MNWNRLFQALDVVVRRFVPCESMTLYIAEERGRYLRRVNTFLESFPPENRGFSVDPVSETSLEGAAAIHAEPKALPSQHKYSADWATREAVAVIPFPAPPTVDDLAAGQCPWPPRDWQPPAESRALDAVCGPVVKKVHNVLAFPIRFGSPCTDPEDPFVDYASSDSNIIGADETVFGVLKLTNRLADRPRRGKQGQRLQRVRKTEADKYKPFTAGDVALLEALNHLLRELYFAVDPVTFGSRIERSLDFAGGSRETSEPLNAPPSQQLGGRSVNRSLQSGCRMLEQGGGIGLFGILGNAFRKPAGQRRRAPELPDLVLRPTLTVVSDSTETMRNAPGWVHKEWTEADLDGIGVERSTPERRRVGGITLLATWRLREDAHVDPFGVICRFQVRIRRVSRQRPGQEALWRELPPFFCIQPDEVTQLYCAFLTDFLHYGEEYVACVRAGSADRWSEWSEISGVALFEASELQPKDPRLPLECVVVAPAPSEVEDAFATKDHHLRFSWPAFESFDARAPLPIEYCVEAWVREDALGAAAVHDGATCPDRGATPADGASPPPRATAATPAAIPGVSADWATARARPVGFVKSSAPEGDLVECTVDVRTSALVHDAFAFFSVRARYLSLPGTHEWSSGAVFTAKPVYVPPVLPSVPAPLPVNGEHFSCEDAESRTASAASNADDCASMGSELVIEWPFLHPANFCPRSAAGVWKRGPYMPAAEDFPLPYRVQCRAALAEAGGASASTCPRWSSWREVRSHEFVRRVVPDRHRSQHSAGHLVQRPLDADCQDESDRFNPNDDPLELQRDAWAVRVVGLNIPEEDVRGAFSHGGLVQLRFVSCFVEGLTSAASRVLCSRVAGLRGPPVVDHIVLNCSSGSSSGHQVSSGFVGDVATDADRISEDVVHELRHVARLAWDLDFRAPSFPFLKKLRVRYREAPPGKAVQDCAWIVLDAALLTAAEDSTRLDGEIQKASFVFNVESVPLLRYHCYEFSVQVRTRECSSAWSAPSDPLVLILPEILPRAVRRAAGILRSQMQLSEGKKVEFESAGEVEDRAFRRDYVEVTFNDLSLKDINSDALSAELIDQICNLGADSAACTSLRVRLRDGAGIVAQISGPPDVLEDVRAQPLSLLEVFGCMAVVTAGAHRLKAAGHVDEPEPEDEEPPSAGGAPAPSAARELGIRASGEPPDAMNATQAVHVEQTAAADDVYASLEHLEAIVCCSDHIDSSSWCIELRWHSFELADGGATKHPALTTLPVEYQISYVVLSKRPCATGADSEAAPHSALDSKEDSVHFLGFSCSDEDKELDAQRQNAVVCFEAVAHPHEAVVERAVPRHRLPPLRCDVRLFVCCRCMAVTGPQWSRLAVAVDVLLPRMAQLPLPVPRPLSCLEGQARGLSLDLGMPGLTGDAPEGFPADGCWAALCIPTFPVEHVVTGTQGHDTAADLLVLDQQEAPNGSRDDHGSMAHYLLQYRDLCGDGSDAGAPLRGGAGARPAHEEHEWRTVPNVRRLPAADGEGIYIASGFGASVEKDASNERGMRFVEFRLASAKMSHFGHASPATCVSFLPQPVGVKVSLEWVDSPSLEALRVRIAAICGRLTEAYQVRYRKSEANPRLSSNWSLCEWSSLTLAARGGGKEDFLLEVFVPVRHLDYHSTYMFSVRTSSDVRFSHWSEESAPVTLSLEHQGMCPVSAGGDINVKLLGQQERHNYRCPFADISWPPLTFPEGVWGPESPCPSPALTIEYRLRVRRRVAAWNDRAALAAGLEELCTSHRPSGLEIIAPDPDADPAAAAAAKKGGGDSTKLRGMERDFAPWQTVAVVPAVASGDRAVERCACALAFLQDSCDYEVAVDWRWRRIGNSFWMPAYGPSPFSTLARLPPPPAPRPCVVPPEVWDACAELHSLGSQRFAVFQWPFSSQPTSRIDPAPPERLMLTGVDLNPLAHGNYAIQCRYPRWPGWQTCDARFLLLQGKPLCFVPKLPPAPQSSAGALADEGVHGEEGDVPIPAETPLPPATAADGLGFGVGEDELEFRLTRSGDCATSPSLPCAVTPPAAPENVACMLRLLPPHSTLVLCVRFHGKEMLGAASVPQQYQVRIDHGDGQIRLLPPVRLALERMPEAFVGVRAQAGYLGAADAPNDRGELGMEFWAARGGGEGLRVLGLLEFEHLIPLAELNYGQSYRISVRWLSQWRVSEWAAPADASVDLAPPRADDDEALEVRALSLVELPSAATAGAVGDACFLPPAVAERTEVRWKPFAVALWGGGELEYEVQRRSMLQRARPVAVTGQGSAAVDDMTPWEVAGIVRGPVDDASGRGLAATGDFDWCRFVCEDLALSSEYQFRVRARLHFNPSAGHPNEWSCFLVSTWHRTAAVQRSPMPPREAVVPDPPPRALLAACTVLLTLPDECVPIREEGRPADAPPVPAPYQLQFRGAEEPPDATWNTASCTQLHGFGGDRFLVVDERLEAFSATGVVFRLWRCPWTSAPDGAQTPQDDSRIRYFTGLKSEASLPMMVGCPQFCAAPRATLLYGERPMLPDIEKEAAAVESAPVILRLDWAVEALKSAALPPLCMHQVRYRLALSTYNVDPDADPSSASRPGSSLACPDDAEGGVHRWHVLCPFERPCTVDSQEVVHELPIGGPHFLFGGEYEVQVRVGTRLRWGSWSKSSLVHLSIAPPEPPEPSGLSVEKVVLEDGAIFFKVKWNAFSPHPLSAVMEYRIRMMRRTRYKYEVRLSEEIARRSAASLAAQGTWHVVGRIRRRVPRVAGMRCTPEEACLPMEPLEFLLDIAADPECGYRFAVDAKHDRSDELRPPADGEVWSAALESEELMTPPPVRNWFVPTPVPLEAAPSAPSFSSRAPTPSRSTPRSTPTPLPTTTAVTVRAPHPLVLAESTLERLGLGGGGRLRALLIFAPWRSGAETSRWPHRIEFAPYIPKANDLRFPPGADLDESEVEWYLPGSVEYISEDEVDHAGGDSTSTQSRAAMAYVRGFDAAAWAREFARLGYVAKDVERLHALGDYVRLRVVREGGPEGLQLFSAPSRPMLVCIPPIEVAPSVGIWCVGGRVCAVLWWPWAAARAGEEDKNLDTSQQVHQIRMRRPFYEHDQGWCEGPTRRTSPPALLNAGHTEKSLLHAFDYCDLFDSSSMPALQSHWPLPQRATGCPRDDAVLTFQFSVRVSDGSRWSEWSEASASVNFALEPKIVEDAPVSVEVLSQLLQPTSFTVCPAAPLPLEGDGDLSDLVGYGAEGDMEPPMWLSVARAPPGVEEAPVAHGVADAATNARMSQFVVTWPNLPPLAYCQPDKRQNHVFEQFLSTGLLPPYVPPVIAYRLNVWLVASAADAAPIADLPEGVVAHESGAPDGAILYRQIDVPPAAFPESLFGGDDADDETTVTVPGGCAAGREQQILRWALPCLPPDRIFRCTLEARFLALPGVIEWWTPLMRSGNFTVERVAPPSPPEPLPICDLPTPECLKLAERAALGSSALIAVRWPWTVEGWAGDLIRKAAYTLEIARSTSRPSVRDPPTKSLVVGGESSVMRPQGPWVQASAMQIYFVNFGTGQVALELPDGPDADRSWVPTLVATGLPSEPLSDKAAIARTSSPEPLAGEWPFVHLRWRYRAKATDLAVIPTPLHFSAASLPVRTRVVGPLGAPQWGLTCPARAKRIVPVLTWTAWAGAVQHQFAFRLLQKTKRRRKRRGGRQGLGGVSSDSESDTDSQRPLGRSGSPSPTAGRSRTHTLEDRIEVGLSRPGTAASIASKPSMPAMTPITGWIEMPPAIEDIERTIVEVTDGNIDVDEPLPEERALAQHVRRLAPHEWNGMLFRHYHRDRDEHFSRCGAGASGSLGAMWEMQSSISEASRPRQSPRPPSAAAAEAARRPSLSQTSIPEVSARRRSASQASLAELDQASRAASMKSARSCEEHMPFRMAWGMQVEWRVRVCDGMRWSQWSTPSPLCGIVPPVPEFTTPVSLTFSRRDPTVLRASWGRCRLPPEFEHLSSTIEYVVYITSDEDTARDHLQATQTTFDTGRLHRKGLQLSDGNCGIVSNFSRTEDARVVDATTSDAKATEIPVFNLEDLFSESSQRRVVGKFKHDDARLVSFGATPDDEVPPEVRAAAEDGAGSNGVTPHSGASPSAVAHHGREAAPAQQQQEAAEQKQGPIIGFEIAVSGLKSMAVHRISVRARCATSGLNEPDFQKTNADVAHPLRWTDPLNSAPVLTPRAPPPLLVPQPLTIPEGRFARFAHTSCLLLRCPMFKKAHPDDFDRDHPVVVDIKPAGAPDEDYRQVPLDYSVYCPLEKYGPCRIVFNLPHFHIEARTRNTTMNVVSAAGPPVFTLPPLVLESQRGPEAEVILGSNGSLFVQLTWTARCLPGQMLDLLQLSLRRHSVESAFVELQATEISPSAIFEEMHVGPLAREAGYEALGLSADQPPAKVCCPVACRRCFREIVNPESVQASCTPTPRGPAGLGGERWLEEGTMPHGEVPPSGGNIGTDDGLRFLRVPHHAEEAMRERRAQEATAQDRHELLGRPLPSGPSRKRKFCQCRDVVLRKQLAVDGDILHHGTTYRFRVRVKDALNWSAWTEFCVPVPVIVAPPKPSVPLRDPLNPVPPPAVEVELLRGPDAVDTLANLLGAQGPSDVRLRLRWPRFEGKMKEVEYRIFMWTLTPEQRSRAATRQPREQRGSCMLPQIAGVQTISLASANAPALPASPERATATCVQEAPSATARAPRFAGDSGESPGDPDAPQIVAHVKPFEPPPRAGKVGHTPKTANAGETTVELPENGKLCADVGVSTLPKGHGYVFGIEAKHSRGTCGGVGEWSSALFTKFIDFDCPPRQLNVEIDARFGSLLFKGQTVASMAKPIDETLVFKAPALSFADEHRNLPRAKPLVPGGGHDAWPHAGDAVSFMPRLKPGGASAAGGGDGAGGTWAPFGVTELPFDRRPHRDDHREHDLRDV